MSAVPSMSIWLFPFVVLAVVARRTDRRPGHRTAPARAERGQATAEYALVVLGAATVAMALVGWATRSGRIAALLDSVIDAVAGRLG